MDGSKLNQEAADRYSQSFTSIVLEDFFSKNSGINGQQIISVTPVKQVNFFVLKVLFEQWQEETKKFKSPFFNYKNADVNGALKSLVNTLSKNILIEKEGFRSLLETAVNDTLLLLFDPENYYIHQSEILPENKDIRSISKYVKVYKSLFDIIALEAEKKPEKNLRPIIIETLNSHSVDESEKENVLNSFGSVLAIDDLLPSNTDDQPIEEITIPEISATEAFGNNSEESINGHNSPIDEEIKNEFEPLSPVADSSEIGNINDQFGGDDITTLNQKYEKEEIQETIASKHESETVSNLSSSININQRYMFLSDLFEGNETDYNIALETIEESSTFDESVEFLVQKYAKQYQWDMNSDEVKEFLKVIFKRFR
ncbi:MAG: hypothetical protein JXR07_09255 [Reichenbachiella sp.]